MAGEGPDLSYGRIIRERNKNFQAHEYMKINVCCLFSYFFFDFVIPVCPVPQTSLPTPTRSSSRRIRKVEVEEEAWGTSYFLYSKHFIIMQNYKFFRPAPFPFPAFSYFHFSFRIVPFTRTRPRRSPRRIRPAVRSIDLTRDRRSAVRGKVSQSTSLPGGHRRRMADAATSGYNGQ